MTIWLSLWRWLAGGQKGGCALEKVRVDYQESEMKEEELCVQVEDYDPVLRWHCRLEETVPTTPR